MRPPPPLACALAVAAGIAVFHGPPATRFHPGERVSVAGTVGGPVAGRGAPLELPDETVWMWSDARVLPGDEVEVTGRIRDPRGPLDPGQPERIRGAELAADDVRVTDSHWTIWRWATLAQRRWATAIDDAGGDPTGAAALRGIATGDRGDVPTALDDRWRAVGIYHVLSVSGLHLAVVAGLLFALLRRLIAASPWGGRIRPARWAAGPALVAAIGYTLATGAQVATLRSLVVVALVMLGHALDRPLRLLDALGVAACGILLARPLDLYDPSFQLSFVAALVLALRPASSRSKLWRGITASAWLAAATAPITAYHFGQVQLAGVVGNLVLTPPVELVALPLALAGVALGASPLIWLASYLVALVDALAGLLAHVAPVGTVAMPSLALAVALVGATAILSSRAQRTRWDLALFAALCVGWVSARRPPPPGALRVTFLDVGQGDAAIAELPDGEVIVIDSGGLPNATNPSATGAIVDRALAAYGHHRVDLAILSHPHPDHYLGFAGMQTPIAARWSARDEHGGEFATWIHPPLGTTLHGEVAIDVLAPSTDGHEEADPVRSTNDNSLVVRLRYRGRSILFAGDLEAEGEAALAPAHADVVKVPHHGSPTSSTPAFVAATRPALAVISCGRGNHFGFPSPVVLDRWRAAGASIARTDEDGAVTVTIGEDGDLAVARFVQK